MTSLNYVSYVAGSGDAGYSHITDLEVITIGADTHLFSSTRYDGVLRRWDIDGGTLDIAQTIAFQGGDRAGGSGEIAALTVGTDLGILTGGGSGGALQTFDPASNGALGSATPLSGLPDYIGGLKHSTTVTLDDGSQAVFGAFAGYGGIVQLSFTATGTLTGNAVRFDSIADTTALIADTASAVVGGTTFLLSASAADNSVTARQLQADGSFGATTTIDADDSLWISAPTALETVELGGVTYAVLASAGTHSLTVIEIGTGGAMIVRDHVMDARDTRFGGVTALDIIEANGMTYVIAGGADDGVSVFALLEGGLLVHRAAIEDTDDVGLNNISALAGTERGNGFDIYAASSSEVGVTQLRYDVGPIGVTQTAVLAGGVLTGTAAADVLQGHMGDDVLLAGAGNDILRDGDGVDTLTGGAGADVFILSADGQTDTITDFTLGEDKIDLSLWPMLRDISQLRITLREDGMQIAYGDEVLVVQSADGTTIDYRDVTTADVIGASRLPTEVVPGYPGPATPLPRDPAPTTGDQGGANSLMTSLQVITAGNIDTLKDAFGSAPTGPASGMVVDGMDMAETIIGNAGFDLILAGGGDDIVSGRGGDDTIFGRAGDDILAGDDGADLIFGGAGRDQLYGGQGHDRLDGGDGNDVLSGGDGDDLMFGQAGADRFVFNSGEDIIADYEAGIDAITIDAALWTGLTSAQDVLFQYGTLNDGRMTIDFENGHILHINGVQDVGLLADDIALF